MKLNFYLDTRPNSKGDHPIIVAFSHQGKRALTTTGYSINPQKWDKNKQEVRQGCSNADGWKWNKVNSHLAKIRATLLDSASKMDVITIEKLKQIFKTEIRQEGKSEQGGVSVSEYIKQFREEAAKENHWRYPTILKFITLEKHLTEFRNPLYFNDIDDVFLNAFTTFLRDKKDHRNTTIGKSLNFLKWFLRWATRKGYNTQLAFQSYAPKLKSANKKVVFLDWDELMQVYNCEPPADNIYLQQVKDVFLFCCFTGLRYSDVANMKRSDVFEDYITITTIKTTDSLTIELNDYSREILRRYKDGTFKNDMALPVLSKQRMNLFLKDLCKLANLNKTETVTYYKGNQRFDEVREKHELVGTHCARRTFICNALMMGIPPQIVMKWTGHSDYKAMKPYIDVADKNKAEAMKLFNKKAEAA